MTEAMLMKEDLYANDVSQLLREHGMLSEDEELPLKQFLRGW